ncbi:MAG TPA: hypothetical protein VE173_06925 [Longimicrobiales bacterium]|nr:hypothetical protein [Longimicrobiales bacterium]
MTRVEGEVFSRCLFCHKPFRRNGLFRRFPRSRRIAFDPARGRLWAVCEHCHRWNLWPLEDRHEALYELERAAMDRATAVAHTANIVLLEVDDVLLVRVGAAELAEQAWWRYGRELRKRKLSFESATSRLTAYTFGAMQLVGEVIGLADPDVDITWDDAPIADILRWRRFGWAAWHGRTTCPYCGSTLRALRYDMSWWVYPLLGEDGRLKVGVPCQRCDPWTPDNLYVIGGIRAETVLRRCLAYQNITGASERVIRDAASAIEGRGTVDRFTRHAVERRECLWKMGPTGTIALEIALSEEAEGRMLTDEARALEFVWRKEEELARIIDEELTPRELLARHLRRLPIRLSRRRPPHPEILAGS